MTPVDTLAGLKALTSRPDLVTMEGYSAPGDGGGGVFYWAAGDSTSPDDGLVVQCTSGAAGRYKRLYSGPINVRWFGAAGDDSTNDSAAFVAAGSAASGKALHIPPGTYKIKNFRVYSNTSVLCDGGVVLKNNDTVDTSGSNSIVLLDGDNIRWTGGKIVGVISNTFGVVPTPYYGMQIFQTSGGTRPVRVTVQDLEVVGGNNGIFAFGTESLTLNNIVVLDQYAYGVACSPTSGAGGPETTKLIIDGLRAERVGLYEGLKIAALYQFTGNAISDIIIDNVIIKDCGRLDTNPANWQEGIDLFLSAGQRVSVSNFIITGCGNGGIELKRNDAPNISPNVLEYIQIKNGQISVDYDNAVGVALNWTTAHSASPNTAGKVSIHNVQIRYNGPASPAQSIGVVGLAYTDVDISNCQFYGAWTYAIDFSPASTSCDSTARRVTVRDCEIHGANTGIVLITGAMENFALIDNVARTTHDTVSIGSSVTGGSGILIDGGRYEVIAGNARYPLSMQANVTDILVQNAVLKSDNYLLVAGNGTGKLLACTLVSAGVGISYATNISGGTWELVNNQVKIPSANRLYYTSGGTVTAWGNDRGSSTSAPTFAAVVGEIVYNSAPAAGGNVGWIATSAGSPATWKTFGGIAP